MSTFQVDLRGMVDLLSRNLYSGPRVYVRELLQNCVDAISARRELDPQAPARISFTIEGNTLTCADTGIGLTEQEAGTLLSTIGASSKRDELGLARSDFLGQFGIGLLSCFMVSPEIDVRSRSAKDPNAPTVHWQGHTDGTYSVDVLDAVDPGVLRQSGTVITLHALPGEVWMEPDTVRSLIDEFGSLLPVEIEVRSQGRTTHHGNAKAPWELPREQQERWLCRKGACDLETTLCAVGEILRLFLCHALEVEDLQQAQCLLRELLLLRTIASDAQYRLDEPVVHVAVVGDLDVVEDGELAEQADVLERTRNAARCDLIGSEPDNALVLKENLARRGAVDPREEVERRRLARAVRPDETDQLAVFDVHVKVRDGLEPAEDHGDIRC